jgi:hypothetical protein
MTATRKLTDEVAREVVARGHATLGDLAASFPDRDRGQLQKALSNAKARGLIRLARRGKGGPGKRDAGLWAAPLPEEQRTRLLHVHVRPPASVFELAHCRQHTGHWPPKCAHSRLHQPLGDWNA